jgi:hypothetical protein
MCGTCTGKILKNCTTTNTQRFVKDFSKVFDEALRVRGGVFGCA